MRISSLSEAVISMLGSICRDTCLSQENDISATLWLVLIIIIRVEVLNVPFIS